MKSNTLLILLISLCLSVKAQDNTTPQNLTHVWGDIDYDGTPWAENVSRPNTIKQGLQGRHISLWASHGRYYDQEKLCWRWQRPNLFSTREDLFTQTIVIPYLIPMLENAGAYVFTPRERDWQKNEVIVDNDGIWPDGQIIKEMRQKTSEVVGFGMHTGAYQDNENPFTAGTALVMNTAKPKKASFISYVPAIPEAGRYAVYVSYPKMEHAIDKAYYVVHHKGMQTVFTVNQQIGYGTWVYLGTFDFDKGTNEDNCVVLTNGSNHSGQVGTDAVRFGGGMGNITRGGSTSRLPRCLEGSRYYGQWAGAPYSVYSSKNGENDYGDDINTRSLMTNWLGGGSVFMPTIEGEGVPFELSLAVHSDAGYNPDGKSIHGSLAIATTDFHDGKLSSGVTRQTSVDLASQLLTNLNNDMLDNFGTWNRRYLWDKNYSETRLPEVPSSIIETLSHQSFPDMAIAQHPYGKFCIARSIYKTVLRYISAQHGKKCVVEPLAPIDFRAELIGDNRVQLSWTGVKDGEDETADPTSYNIYTSLGNLGFDNGQNVKSTSVTIKLEKEMQYNFRVTACNDGGESFPTEVLSVYIAPNCEKTILVVNGFERLSAPYIIDNDSLQGFDLSEDEGVQRELYPGWSGQQKCYTKSTMGSELTTGLGYSSDELAGQFIAGNTFDFVKEHTTAIASSKRYSVVSSSLSALTKGYVNMNRYDVVDLAFGLQKDDGQLGIHYKTFSPKLRSLLTAYVKAGGRIIASGSFLGSDMQTTEEKLFMKEVMKVKYNDKVKPTADALFGMGLEFNFYKTLNEKHYATTHPESLSPSDGAICALQYSDGQSAGVGYKGTYSTFVTGFPLECIRSEKTRNQVMQGIISYLVK